MICEGSFLVVLFVCPLELFFAISAALDVPYKTQFLSFAFKSEPVVSLHGYKNELSHIFGFLA